MKHIKYFISGAISFTVTALLCAFYIWTWNTFSLIPEILGSLVIIYYWGMVSEKNT